MTGAMGKSALAAMLLVSGCGALRDRANWDQEMVRLVGAEPLVGAYALSATSAPVGIEGVDAAKEPIWIGLAANDSVRKCQAWVARLAVGQTAVNTMLDITAIGLAGAGAITIPLRSAQTLSALAGITTASKAAINSDVFAQNTAPIIAQQVSKTYWANIQNVIREAPTANATNLASLYGKLLVTHNQCSLPMALASLTTDATAKPVANPAVTATDLTKGALLTDLKTRTQYRVVDVLLSSGKIKVTKWPVGAKEPTTSPDELAPADFLKLVTADYTFVQIPGA